jgi:hypothetical protein
MVQLASASSQLPPEISPLISQHAAPLIKLLVLVVLVLVLDAAADLALVPHTR